MGTSALSRVADGVTMIDTAMTGQRELNAVYVLDGPDPTLVEAGPEVDGPIVAGALSRLGIGPDDLAHIVLTHVHMDHAGGAGALLTRFPRANVWIHERGAPHLVDPSRLVASTERTYGRERLARFFGDMTPCDAGRVRAVRDGDRIDLGGRTLAVIGTPGHASHHVALHDSGNGAVFTGEAIGSFLPWAPAYRPALPAPEVDLEAFEASVGAIRQVQPTALLTSHFGPTPDVDGALEAAVTSARRWGEAVRACLRADPHADPDVVIGALRSIANDELHGAGMSLDDVIDRYDALGTIAMNAAGLTRYWRRRWEREAQPS
jgi:glyoxylase-like metal-dependent hydrolase (beta-lactamase superfamily II)